MKLKQKVILSFLAVISLSASLIIGMTWKSVTTALISTLEETATAQGMDLAEENVVGFQTESEVLLLPRLQATQEISGAEEIAAIGSTGRIFAHTNVGEKGQTLSDPFTVQTLRDHRVVARVMKRGRRSFMEVWCPVSQTEEKTSSDEFLLEGNDSLQTSDRLGAIRIRLPMQATFQTRDLIVRKVSLIVAIAGLVAFFITLAGMRRFLTAIRLLTQGTSHIAKGQYGIEIPVVSRDEFGDLARSFNSMSHILQETTVSKNVLAESEQRFRQLTENVQEVFWLCTPDNSEMVYISPSYERVWGRSCKSLYESPRSFVEAVHAEDSARVMGALQKLSTGFDERYRIVQPDGKIRSIHARAFPVRNTAGEVYRIAGIAEDVTDRIHMESILRQSEKLSAVGQLAAGVAHEINNPLGVILGFAQAALRRLTPGEVLEMPLKSIEKEALRCKDLVQDLLTFSRASKVDREPMDLNKAIIGALSLVSAQARTKQIEVRQDLAEGLPRMLGNPSQIQQIIVNLANNAFDAMESKGSFSIVTQSITDGPLSWISLTVSDTGAGIPADVLPRIYEPFFTTKPVGKGTGLGLSLIHEIVNKHSGTIDVKSRPGCTEFVMRFPVRLTERSTPHVHA